MSSMNMFFVRKVTDDDLSTVRAMFPSVEIDTNSEFIRARFDGYVKIPEQDLMGLSSRLEAEIIWLSYQSVVDAFEYYHWRAGRLLRALVYGCYVEERTWERVEGQPEAWEQQFFFDPEELTFLLDDEEDEEEDKLSYEEKRRLEQFWQNGKLEVGRHEPHLGAQRCAFHVAAYYRFPGWDK